MTTALTISRHGTHGNKATKDRQKGRLFQPFPDLSALFRMDCSPCVGFLFFVYRVPISDPHFFSPTILFRMAATDTFHRTFALLLSRFRSRMDLNRSVVLLFGILRILLLLLSLQLQVLIHIGHVIGKGLFAIRLHIEGPSQLLLAFWP